MNIIKSALLCGILALPLTANAAFIDSGSLTGSGSTVIANAGSSGTSYTSAVTSWQVRVTTSGSHAAGIRIVSGTTIVSTARW